MVNEYNVTSVALKEIYTGSISFCLNPILVNHKQCVYCLTSHAISQLLELLFVTRDTKGPDTPRELPRHTSVLLNNISRIQYWMHPPRSCFRQTCIYPVKNRYLTYLIHRNETDKWVSFQYKSLPMHTNTQRRPKEQMLHWLMVIYKMFISAFSPSQSFSLACRVCLAVRLYGGVRGWALISVCLFIYICTLAISICGGVQRGGFAGDNSPQLSLSGQMERGLFLTENSGWVEYQCPALVGQTPLKWCPSISCDIFTQNGPIPDVFVWKNRIWTPSWNMSIDNWKIWPHFTDNRQSGTRLLCSLAKAKRLMVTIEV